MKSSPPDAAVGVTGRAGPPWAVSALPAGASSVSSNKVVAMRMDFMVSLFRNSLIYRNTAKLGIVTLSGFAP